MRLFHTLMQLVGDRYKWGVLLLVLSTLVCFGGCGPANRHKVLSTIFDGVPSLPSEEQLCQDFVQRMAQSEESGQGALKSGEDSAKPGSEHKPYAEKRCSDCHSKTMDEQGGLIRPKRELCFVCHGDLLQGEFVHGPVAVGDCLACHLPHNSPNEALLKKGKNELCALCHQEKRLAITMHDRLAARKFACGECHDPHAGHARYFLK